jgi:hypothetical protein
MTSASIVVRTARIVAALAAGRQLSARSSLRRSWVCVLFSVVVVSGCASPATVTTFPTTSDAPVYLVDADTNTSYANGTQLDWDARLGVVLSAIPAPTAPTDIEAMRLPFVNGSLTETPFLSAPGSERKPTDWKGFGETLPLNGKGSILRDVSPSSFLNGAPASVKAAGGTYSLGVAYCDSPTHVTAAFFTTIAVDAGKGTWKFATPKK